LWKDYKSDAVPNGDLARAGLCRSRREGEWRTLAHLVESRQRLQRSVALAVAVLALVALSAGCTSSASKSSPIDSITTTTTTPTSSTTAPSLTPSTTSSTAPPALDGAQCAASDLQPSWTGMDNGGGQSIYYVVNLLNSSPSACITGGYVGVSAYDPAGHLITASEYRIPFGQSPPTLSVAPGASLYFVVGLADVDQVAGGTECSVTVGALHLIPPNESTEVQIATPTTTGYPKLCMPTVGVGPLQNGTGND